jgi:TolA-binding protein
MTRRLAWPAGILILCLSGCGPAKETSTPPVPAAAPRTAEMFTLEGRRLYAAGEIDSAATALAEALRMDSTYRPALEQKALMFYDLVMREQGDARRRMEASLTARNAYMQLERMGIKESDVYERISELSNILGDDKTLLHYAKKNAEQFPYDRQYYNLGLAFIRTGDYNGAITLLKGCTEKFPSSAFIGGFYRQLGKAYASVDRDQTAERTYGAGVKAVNALLAESGTAGNAAAVRADRQRLTDDKIAMLLALKKLHQRYRHEEQLKDVERQLKEAGYEK